MFLDNPYGTCQEGQYILEPQFHQYSEVSKDVVYEHIKHMVNLSEKSITNGRFSISIRPLNGSNSILLLERYELPSIVHVFFQFYCFSLFEKESSQN